MPSSLEIQYLSGESEHVRLKPDEPVSIGSGSANDICVDEPGVEKIHCRIGYKQGRYALASAVADGVEVNGQLVTQKVLESGDVISIGSVDLAVTLDKSELGSASGAAAAASSGPDVAAAIFEDDDEDDFAMLEDDGDDSPMVLTPESGPQKSSKPRASADDDLFEDDDVFEEEDDDLFDDAPKKKGKKQDKAAKEDSGSKAEGEEKSDSPPEKPSLESLKSRGGRQRLRPSERESVRSPFVLGLIGGGLILLLSAAVFYFMIGRQTAQQQYDLAKAQKDEGKYNQAIQSYEAFLELYPSHALSELSEFELGQSKIEAKLRGGTPDFGQSLEEFNNYIDKFRERENFKEQYPLLEGYAQEIALGAAQSATQRADTALLDISTRAQNKHNIYINRDDPPESVIAAIDAAQKAAAAAIAKRETTERQTVLVERALAADPPNTVAALKARRALLRDYPDLRDSKQIRAMTEEILESERKTVVGREEFRDALTDPPPSATGNTLSLILHNRSLTEEKPSGRCVVAVADHALYGIDTATGGPAWRYVCGLDLPFFPVDVQTSVEGVLFFATHGNELTLLERNTGKLVWRQPLQGVPSGPPLEFQGQLYLSTSDGLLYKISLDTGRISSVLEANQPLLSPPAILASSNNLIVLGDEELAYTISTNPFACVAVTETAHAPGSIASPALRMENFLLVCENQTSDDSRLRVFQLDAETNRLVQVASDSVTGHVRNPAELRGTQLLVPSGKERVTGFTVSDSVDQDVLSKVGSHVMQEGRDAPMFLTWGSDGLFWMASSALRKYRLNPDSVVLSERAIAPGYYTQPLSPVGERMFAGRRLPYSNAVYFSLVNSDEMRGFGRVILGSRVLATAPVDDTLFALTEAGHLFRVLPGEVGQEFKTDAALQIELMPQKFEDQLEVLDADSQPLQAKTLADGRIAAWCGNPLPRVWVVNERGEFDLQLGLPEPLEAEPALIDAGLVLPLSGRLRVATLSPSSPKVADFVAVAGGESAAKWQSLLRIDGGSVLALDSTGLMRRVQFVSQNPHLSEASRYELPGPIDLAPVLAGSKLYVATPDAQLLEMDSQSYDILKQVALPGSPTGRLTALQGHLLVEVNSSQLHCFDADGLLPVWPDPLPTGFGGVAGTPLAHDGLWVIAHRSGAVSHVDPATGQPANRHELGEPLVSGPITFGGRVLIPTLDGSLHKLPSGADAGGDAAAE